MSRNDVEDRIAGALMGAWIGDALGLGPHWFYDLDEQHKHYGEWIDGYTDPMPGRYHENMRAGQLSQAGLILRLLTDSLLDRDGYDHQDFCRRLDEDLFPQLDGTPTAGPGGYTNQSIREAWRCRVEQNKPWTETGGKADTTESIERCIAIALRHAQDPRKMAEAVVQNTVLTQTDDVIVSMTVAFCSVLMLLVQGRQLDSEISTRLMALVKNGNLPFHTVTNGNLQPPRPGEADMPRVGNFASPDALMTPGFIAAAASDPGIRIEPAWKVSIAYGMPCAIYHILPASYYLAARFHDDFESAVLHAINGGGQNLARAMLAGALVGAQVGLSGIPDRFIQGLGQGDRLVEVARKLAEQAA